MEDIFSPKTILKPNTSLFESLPLFSSEIFFFFWFIDFALMDFCTFRKLRPSICIFNLTSAFGEISVIICKQVNNFFHFWEISTITIYQVNTLFHFQEICFHSWEISIVTRLIPFSTSGELVSTSWEISINTFYQVNTTFHFRGTHFHFPGKSQLLPSTS